MQVEKKDRVFDPRETARMAALAGLPLATFRQRAGAFALDVFVVLATYVPAVFGLRYLLMDRLHLEENLYHSGHVRVTFDFQALAEVAWTVWMVIYFGLFAWATNGSTPGKRLFGIRVVSLSHARITLWQAVERSLGYGASMLELGSGFFQYFIHPNRCCVHDRIAETIVVKDRKGTRLSEQAAEND